MMVTKRAIAAGVGVLLAVGLLLPPNALAKTQTVLGSLMITGASPTDLSGVAAIHNPGFEKTISQQIPPLVFPVFVDLDEDDVSGAVLNKRFDTLVTLTNTTGSPLNNITLTLLDASGATTLGMKTLNLGPHASVLVFVSDLLP
jgi:hypothetical protein